MTTPAAQSADELAMPSGEARDVDAVRALVIQALKAYPARVFLFGSRAIGVPRPMSDIDVAVWHEGSVPASVFAHIREQLEESNILRKVDLIDLAEAGGKLRQRVFAQGVEWSV